MKLFLILFRNLLILTLVSCLWVPVSEAKKEDKPDLKKMCEQALKESKELNQELDKIKEERSKLNAQYLKAQQDFLKYKADLRPLVGCVVGKPSNSPECKRVLKGQRDATAELDRIQLLQRDNAKKKLALENKLFKPQGVIQGYKCTQ